MSSPWAVEEERLRRLLAANLRALRAARKLSVEAAAHNGAMHWRHWQKIEKRQASVTLRTLAKLAQGLGVETTELLQPLPTDLVSE